MKVLLFVMVLGVVSASADEPSTCAGTREECLQKQVIELRQALAQTQIEMMNRDLKAAWASLELEVRTRLKAKPEDEIDLTTLTIKPRKTDAAVGAKEPPHKEK